MWLVAFLQQSSSGSANNVTQGMRKRASFKSTDRFAPEVGVMWARSEQSNSRVRQGPCKLVLQLTPKLLLL